MKRCTKCEVEKPLDAFYVRDGKPIAACKDCTKAKVAEHQKANRERRNAYLRVYQPKWRAENPEKERAKTERYQKGESRDKYLAARKRHAVANRDRLREESKAYYWANRETLLARRAEYNRLHPEKKRASRDPEKNRKYANEYRARKIAAFVEEVIEEDVILRDEGRCGICGEPIIGHEDPLEFDHIVPLAAGGWHALNNVQMSHRSCNRRKHANPEYRAA